MIFWKPDKKFCLLLGVFFTAGFVAGALLMKTHGAGEGETAGFFGDYYLSQYAYLEVDRRDLACLVAKERGKWFLLMWTLGFTSVGSYLVYAFSGLWGFFTAVLAVSAFTQRGIEGIGLVLLFSLPQILIYVPLWIWFLGVVSQKSEVCRKVRKMGAAVKNNWQYMMCLIAGGSILLLGILTESYLNSWLIQQILRFL